MADTSNTFSLNGLNRQKKLSGIYARRPENIDQYFTRTSLNIPPMYVRCLSAKINNAGNDQYSYGCYPVFPDPQHPSGIRASGTINLAFTSNSFTLSNPGSNYEIGDSFFVTNEAGELNGRIAVASTGSNGSVSSVDFVDLSSASAKITPLSTNISHAFNNTASFSIDSGNFKISNIVMNHFGHGYQTFDNTTKQTTTHSVSISGAGNGSGHDITCSFTPLILNESNPNQLPTYLSDKQFSNAQIKTLFNTYSVTVVMNDTLTQP